MRLKLVDLSQTRMYFERCGSGNEGPGRSLAQSPPKLVAEIAALIVASFPGSGVVIETPTIDEATIARLRDAVDGWTVFEHDDKNPKPKSPDNLILSFGSLTNVIPRSREALVAAMYQLGATDLFVAANLETRLDEWVDGTLQEEESAVSYVPPHSLLLSLDTIVSIFANYEDIDIRVSDPSKNLECFAAIIRAVQIFNGDL